MSSAHLLKPAIDNNAAKEPMDLFAWRKSTVMVSKATLLYHLLECCWLINFCLKDWWMMVKIPPLSDWWICR